MRSVARRANATHAVLKNTRAALRSLVLALLNAGEDPEEVVNTVAEASVYPSTILQWNEHADAAERLSPEALLRFESFRNTLHHERIEATSQRDIARSTFRKVRTGTRHEANDQRWNALLERYREMKREHRAFHGTPYEYGANRYAYEGSAAVSELDAVVDELRGLLTEAAADRNPTWNPEEELPTESDTAAAPSEYTDLDAIYGDEDEELPDYFPEDGE